MHEIENSYKEAVEDRTQTRSTKIPSLVAAGLVFLLPLIFIPLRWFSFQEVKVLFVFFTVVVSLFFWIINKLRSNSFSLPYNGFVIATILVPLGYVFASFFSPTPIASLLGTNFELDSALFIVTSFLLVLIASSVYRSKESALYSYLAFFASFALLVLFHLARMIAVPFGINFLHFNIFTDVTTNTIGKWSDLSIFVGLGALLTLLAAELLVLKRVVKKILYTFTACAIFLLAAANFQLVWIVLGAMLIAFFVLVFSINKGDTSHKSQVPVATLLVIAIAVVAVLGEPLIGQSLQQLFHISYIEVRPSWSGTLDTAFAAIKHNPFFGAGPEHFVDLWLRNKSAGINLTQLWNTDFNYGVGFIPTLIVNTGIVGLFTWVMFMVYMVYYGVIGVFRKNLGHFSRFSVFASFAATLYLWIFDVIYVPGTVLWVLTFIFTGMFIATLQSEKILTLKTFTFKKSPQAGFAYVLSLVVFLILAVVASYIMVGRAVAFAYYQNAVNTQNIDTAEANLGRALTIQKADAYFRAYSQLEVGRANQISQKNLPQDTMRVQLQNAFANAIGAAQQAVAENPSNYQNYLALGNAYTALVPVQGAYEQAKSAYNKALELNPKSPAIMLTLARLELANKNVDGAMADIRQALTLKKDYTDAVFLLSQIQIAQGDTKSAIQSVSSAAGLAPNDPTVFFQLGFLLYSDKQYENAIPALERAVMLVPTYANAKYFLGLSYENVGRHQDAINQFKDIQTLNPDNQEVAFIISNLEAGKDPFAQAKPPIDTKPEKRKTLPLTDKAKADTTQ